MMPYTETLSVGKPVTLFGALDCSTWAYDMANKTQLSATTDTVALSLTSAASGTQVHDFAITAADALTPGGSSIAVLDDQAGLTLKNVDVAAGAGKAGTAGAPQSQVTTPASANGDRRRRRRHVHERGAHHGRRRVAPTRAAAPRPTAAAAARGPPERPAATGAQRAADDGAANGGSGPDQTAPCQRHRDSATARKAALVPPAPARAGSATSRASGYHGPPAGTRGGEAAPAKAVEAAAALAACDTNDMYAGPSGGGGGAGGCGGAAGNFGTSGGSSIGILALGGSLTLTSVSITTHAGGAGGLGGNGQPGGGGGQHGQRRAAANACAGGTGGQGGAGGPGGGGAGGHSVAVAIEGGTLPDLSTTTIVPGSGGMGSAGGDMDMTAQTKGDSGKACKTLDFTPTTTAPCVM